MPHTHCYLFLNAAVFLTAVTLTWGRPEWRRILSRKWIVRAAAIFTFWCVVDWTAVSLRLWEFPAGGTLRFRFMGLPFEEYLVFVVHAVLTTFAAGEPGHAP
jgi:lycopene cyclase domain-containing protein